MDYKNILMIKMSSLGDVIHALPFAAALRDRYPKSRISWLVHPQFSAFVPDPPLIDEVLYFDKAAFNKMNWRDKWCTYRTLRQTLRSRHFDLVIDLQGLFKSAVMALLTGCSQRIGYCEMREGSGLVSRPIVGPHRNDHVIERYLDVARYLGAKVDTIRYPMPPMHKEQESVHKNLIAAGMPEGERQPYVVFVPGARWDTKRWPVEYFARLAMLVIQDGYYVVLAGGTGDKPLGEKIRKAVKDHPHLVDLLGRPPCGNWGP